MKRVLILGIGGQVGSYLAELLLKKGYEVYGLYRRSSVDNLVRIAHIKDRVTLHPGDLLDVGSVREIVQVAYGINDGPLEVYNMADQDHVGFSEECPGYSVSVTAGGVSTVLEVCQHTEELCGSIRVYQPLSATMFGVNADGADESTPFAPMSPYACAKVHAYYLCQMYRSRGLFVSTGICYNHDSPRRGPDYLLQRITRQAVQVARTLIPEVSATRGERKTLDIYSPKSRIDIGHAEDFAWAAWRMLQLDAPDDFVLGTGCGYQVQEMARLALGQVGVPLSALRVVGGPEIPDMVAPSLKQAQEVKACRVFDWNPRPTGKVIEELVRHHMEKP